MSSMTTINDYLDKHASMSQREILERIRKLAHEIVPDAEEVISYGVPTIKYKGTYVVYFAAFKDHMSLYPASDGLLEEVKLLEPFRKAKGTLHFTEKNQIPEPVLKKTIEYMLKEAAGRAGY